METTTKHGAIADKTQNKLTKFYNLDAIIADKSLPKTTPDCMGL
jgi:hypothetical protein